ncbi:MAG TPA: formylmethanofuran dehydrogenase [Peptococcaceae bacterium]|nr:formylmethanofuran dehydrogenase [Peptococcaceae bacterium]
MEKNKTDWERAVEFHGHSCPGLAIGFRAAKVAQEKMGLTFSANEEFVCVTENDACGVDAIQLLTGCSIGKGNLIYRGTGKMAYSFFNRKTGESLRIVVKLQTKEMSREERQEYILNAPAEEIFNFRKPAFSLPEEARIFQSVTCESCGESAPENKIRLQDGKKVCLDCFKDYCRGW